MPIFRAGNNPIVIPAQAGIQYGAGSHDRFSGQDRSYIPMRKRRGNGKALLDSRLRGNDEWAGAGEQGT
ncbi:MAG: hypothetical protein FWG81_01970 [Betaproteobacteria bacterium]|nr:hypothetical protein [Betaproteobacteria bacterium]